MEQERVDVRRCRGLLQDGRECRKYLGTMNHGELVMTHHNRTSRVQGRIEIECERCHSVTVIETNA